MQKRNRKELNIFWGSASGQNEGNGPAEFHENAKILAHSVEI